MLPSFASLLLPIVLALSFTFLAPSLSAQDLSLPAPLLRPLPTRVHRGPHPAVREAHRLRELRWVLSPVVGFATGGVLALLSGITASALMCNPTNTYETCVGAVVLGAYAGFLLGAPLGLSLSAGWLHGLGLYSGAFLGTLFGVALAVPLALIARSETVTYSIGAIPALAGLLVYELQGAARGRSLRGPITPRSPSAGIFLSPSVTPVNYDGRISGLSVGLTLRGF